MKKTYKLASIFLIIILLFMISLMTYYNDLKNYTIVFGSLTVICFIYMIYIVFNKTDNETIYKRKINKILKIYNSSIVKINNDFELTNSNIVKSKNVEDLFELSDELNIPIVFVEEDKASIFILQYGKDILYYILKIDENVDSKFEKEINEFKKKNNDEKNKEKELLSNIDKTTIIQLKNNKFYKVKPVKK
ncbi:MAG: hypothetical protein J5970_04770 [Bacilli bacterium]|nr:hypothetical protein [Bacilli bacterium]